MRNQENAKTRIGFSYMKTRVKKQAEDFLHASYLALAMTVIVMILTEIYFPNFILQDGLFSDWQRSFNSSKPFYSPVAGQYLDPAVVKGALVTEILDSMIFSVFYFFGVLITCMVLVFPFYNKIIAKEVAGLTDDKILEGSEVLEDDKFLAIFNKLSKEEENPEDSFSLTKVYNFDKVRRVPKAGKFIDLDSRK